MWMVTGGEKEHREDDEILGYLRILEGTSNANNVGMVTGIVAPSAKRRMDVLEIQRVRGGI